MEVTAQDLETFGYRIERDGRNPRWILDLHTESAEFPGCAETVTETFPSKSTAEARVRRIRAGERARTATICHASRHPLARKELPDLVPGDLIVSGTGVTCYGGGLGIMRIAAVSRVVRELIPGRGGIAVCWRAYDARGRVLASGPREWSSAGVASPGTPA